jgi:hypothetical protein
MIEEGLGKLRNGETAISPIRRLAASFALLSPDHGDQMAQLVFNVTGRSNRVGNLLS